MFSVKSASAEICAPSAICWEHTCRNHTKDGVGHFPHVEKAVQGRLGELHMKRKLREYRAKGQQILKLSSPLIFCSLRRSQQDLSH